MHHCTYISNQTSLLPQPTPAIFLSTVTALVLYSIPVALNVELLRLNEHV